MRHLREGKITENPTFYEDLYEYIPSIQSRPKFYEQVSFTPEEIDLKRQKFESQFISKKQIPVFEHPQAIAT